MALQVWMPLNGNLNNLGLSNITSSSASGITYSDGKIGKCLSASSNVTVTITLSNLAAMLANGTTYSLSCWVKLTNNVTSGWVIKLGTNTCGLWWSSSEARWVWNENDNGKRCANPTISADTNWHHLVTTIDKTVTNQITAKHYVDGLPASGYETHTWDCSGQSQPAGNTITISPYVAMLNDVRLYDHCLSKKEVKEISKGLVCHYMLANNGIGMPNINTWTYSKNPNFSHSAGNTVLSLTDNNDYVRYTCTTVGSSGGRYDYPCGSGDTSVLVEGNVYTWSADFRASTSITFSGNSNAKMGFEGGGYLTGAAFTIGTEWVRLSYTWTQTTSKAFVFYPSSALPVNEWIEIRNLKCEEGPKSTTYIPGINDPTYSAQAFAPSIEYNCSGYGNHGTKTGIITYNSDTPRNSVCTKFSNDTYIRINPMPAISGYANSYTFSWWGNYSSTGSKMMWGYQNGNRLNLYLNSDKFFWNTNDGNNNPFSTVSSAEYLNSWHHFAITGDGTTTKLYIDGVFKANATTYRAITGTDLIMNGWNTDNNYDFNGTLSDFRLYATVLSESDIKELYNQPISFNKHSIIIQGEYIEK